ncbi:MAG: DNA-3-methyladenine glycosylase [Planctomycetota bacterium]
MASTDTSPFETGAGQAARALLGTTLTRTLPTGERLAGVITETEAYVGPEDLASHAVGGRRTPRSESMWAKPGTAYVYFTYGMHHCLNVSCLRADHPAAVLIRAIRPNEGIDFMRANRAGNKPRKHPLRDRDLTNGPGKLCQALAIDLDLDGIDLLQSPHLAISGPFGAADPDRITATPRIGLGDVGEWGEAPLRFVLD